MRSKYARLPSVVPLLTFFVGILLYTGCSSSKKFSGFSYDPQGSTVTTDKNIKPQHKRTIGIAKDGIWVSNEFAGARMSDFYKVSDSLYRVVIKPERYPVNDSPWYAFKIYSDKPKRINLQLTYQHGNHRYVPNLSSDGHHWHNIASTNYHPDTTKGTATLNLSLTKKPLWVAAQELITLHDIQKWSDSLAHHSSTTIDTVGYSHDHRPILRLKIAPEPDNKPQGVLIINGRLHPPEVTGQLACMQFIEALTSSSALAKKFRRHFEIWAYPMANPDGVAHGNWRSNAAGVDLNRDWQAFNQPETHAIKNSLLNIKNMQNRKVYYGIDFHSTDENIFYPINRNVATFPEDFTYGWVSKIKAAFPNIAFAVEPFDTSSPITKNWIYKTFGADAVTYEVDDTMNRDSLRAVSQKSARLIMKGLVETWAQRHAE